MRNFPRTTTRSIARSVTGAIAAFGIAVALAGCATGAQNSADADGLQIVTTTTQLIDFTINVTEGTDAAVTGLLQPGASAHSFEVNAADLELIRTSDVVIMNGLGLEPWLEDTLEAAGFAGVLIDASAGISDDQIIASNEGAGDEHAHEGEDTHEEDEHAEDHAHDEDAHAEEDSHEGHNHGEHNPHIWTSPIMAGDMTTEIAEELASVDESNAETYLANASTYVAELSLLDEWIAANIDTVPAEERLLVSNHDALTYYNHDYGITFVGSVMPSWDDNAEPSAAEIDALVAAIKESGAPAVFSETQLSPGTAEAIAQEAGVKIYSGDAALYTDALGAEGTDGDTYIASTIHNTTQLLDSWGATPTEVPTELQNL